MTMILTTKGELDESTLVKTTGEHEDDQVILSWEEWQLDGEIVKRNVAMTLKEGVSLMADNSFN